MDCLWKLGPNMEAEYTECKEKGQAIRIITITRYIQHKISIDDLLIQLTSDVLDGDKRRDLSNKRKSRQTLIGRNVLNHLDIQVGILQSFF